MKTNDCSAGCGDVTALDLDVEREFDLFFLRIDRFDLAARHHRVADIAGTPVGVLELHQFAWLGDEALIGALQPRWNHLVGYDAPAEDIGVLHYTTGGPYFEQYAAVPYADVWRDYRRRATHAGPVSQTEATAATPSAEGTHDR